MYLTVDLTSAPLPSCSWQQAKGETLKYQKWCLWTPSAALCWFSWHEASEASREADGETGREPTSECKVFSHIIVSPCVCVSTGPQLGPWDHRRMNLEQWQCQAGMQQTCQKPLTKERNTTSDMSWHAIESLEFIVGQKISDFYIKIVGKTHRIREQLHIQLPHESPNTCQQHTSVHI